MLVLDKSRNRKYAKIFEPITRTLRDLSDISVKGTENLIDTETPLHNDDDLISSTKMAVVGHFGWVP